MKDQCTSTEQDSLVYVGKLPRLTGLCGEVAQTHWFMWGSCPDSLVYVGKLPRLPGLCGEVALDYQKVWLSTGLVISE